MQLLTHRMIITGIKYYMFILKDFNSYSEHSMCLYRSQALNAEWTLLTKSVLALRYRLNNYE